jgi:hypothetical protein
LYRKVAFFYMQLGAVGWWVCDVYGCRARRAGPKSLLRAPPNEISGHPVVLGTTFVQNTILHGFASSCGGPSASVAIAANPLALDTTAGVRTSGIVLDGTTAAVFFDDTVPTKQPALARSGAVLAQCSVLGCDADSHRLVIDDDGSLTGLNVPSSIVSMCAIPCLLPFGSALCRALHAWRWHDVLLRAPCDLLLAQELASGPYCRFQRCLQDPHKRVFHSIMDDGHPLVSRPWKTSVGRIAHVSLRVVSPLIQGGMCVVGVAAHVDVPWALPPLGHREL